VSDARDGIARVDRTRVPIIHLQGRTRGTLAVAIAGLCSVADVAVSALCPLESWDVGNLARLSIAGVHGAGVPIIRDGSACRYTGSDGIAGVDSVASVAVRTRSSSFNRDELRAEERIAGVGGARIPVVKDRNDERHAGSLCRAAFKTVAYVPVAANRSFFHRHMSDTCNRIAGIDRTRIPIIHNRSGSRSALPRDIAQFKAVARIAIATRDPGSRDVRHPCRRVARVGRARVPIIDLRRRSSLTLTRPVARFRPVASVPILAETPGRRRSMDDP
jgi:hypothetical protein